MREIRFRAWDKTRIVMIGTGYPNNWGDDKDEWWADNDKMCLEGISDASSNENLCLMQYTGLKDKNGVKIYEGDILSINGYDINLLVKYENCSFVAYHTNLYAGRDDIKWGDLSRLCDIDMKDIYLLIEVIGNAYENKDLLK